MHYKSEDGLFARSDDMTSRNQEQLNSIRSVPQQETIFSTNGHIHLYTPGSCFNYVPLYFVYTDTIKEVSIEIENVHYLSVQSGHTKQKYVETADDQEYTTVTFKKQSEYKKGISMCASILGRSLSCSLC